MEQVADPARPPQDRPRGNGAGRSAAAGSAESWQSFRQELWRIGRDLVEARAEAGKRAGADRLDGAARYFTEASDAFAAELPVAATCSQDAARHLQAFARQLRECSCAQLADDANGLARRHPRAFVLGGLLLGFGAARFFKSRPLES